MTLLLCCRLSSVSTFAMINNTSSIPAALTSRLLWGHRGSTDAQHRRMFPTANRNFKISVSVGSEWGGFKLFCSTFETPHWNVVEALCIKEQRQRYLIAINILKCLKSVNEVGKGSELNEKSEMYQSQTLLLRFPKFSVEIWNGPEAFISTAPNFLLGKSLVEKRGWLKKDRTPNNRRYSWEAAALALPCFLCSGRTKVLFCSSTNPQQCDEEVWLQSCYSADVPIVKLDLSCLFPACCFLSSTSAAITTMQTRAWRSRRAANT